MKSIIAALVATLLVAACSSTGDTQPPAPVTEREPSKPPTPPTTGGGTPPPVVGGVIPTVEPKGTDELTKGILAERSVYFDLDKYEVSDKYRPLVEAHAAYLRKNPGQRLVIEGNTDERGSREYNLSLGQKRAEAVKKMLQLLGVPETQLEAVSFGEEKPKATGTDDAAYAQNRRGDLSYRAR